MNADYPDGLLLHDRTYGTLQGKPSSLHRQLLLELLPPVEAKKVIFVLYPEGAGFVDAYFQEYFTLQQL